MESADKKSKEMSLSTSFERAKADFYKVLEEDED